LQTLRVADAVADLVGATAFAAQDMAAERRAAALFDGRHNLQLCKAQMTALCLIPAGAVDAKDVGDL
jgi:hypothetical protein